MPTATLPEDLIVLSWDTQLEIRTGEGDGREVSGIIVPWDRPTKGPGAYEVFKAGSLTKTIAERGTKVSLRLGHDPSNVIGRAIEYRNDPRGQWASFHISKTAKGDEALELIRDGVIHSFSVGFAKFDHKTTNTRAVDGLPVFERREVKLMHVALTDAPFYSDATIQQLREADMVADINTKRMTVAEARRKLSRY